MRDNNNLFYISGAVKRTGPNGEVGGYLVRFTDATSPDLDGEFFTKDTYFGPRDGDESDCLFDHGMPVKRGLEKLADEWFAPIKTRRDDVGIFASTVLKESDAYQKQVLDLIDQGKIGWSSGSAPHLVKKKSSGEITRWPIIEGSLTHRPAEPRNVVITTKSFREMVEADAPAGKSVASTYKEELAENTNGYTIISAMECALCDIERQQDAADTLSITLDTTAMVDELLTAVTADLRAYCIQRLSDDDEEYDEMPAGGALMSSRHPTKTLVSLKADQASRLNLDVHSQMLASSAAEIASNVDGFSKAVDPFSEHAEQRHNVRIKSGRVLSAATREHMQATHDTMGTAKEHLSVAQEKIKTLLDKTAPKPKVDQSKRLQMRQALRALELEALQIGI